MKTTTSPNGAPNPLEPGSSSGPLSGPRQRLKLKAPGAPRERGLSLVIPVYNERDSLPRLIEQVYEAAALCGEPWELILVDDHSRDDSAAWLAANPRPEVRVIRLKHNSGQSTAVLVGLRASRFDKVATLDGDLQNDPRDLPKLIAALPGADMVCGYRVGRQDTLWKRIVSRAANRLRSSLTGDGVRDTGCSLKLFSSEVAEKMAFFRGGHRFMPALAQLEGFTVVEVPVSHHAREMGVTKYGSFGRLKETVPDLLGFLWLKSRYPKYDAEEQ